MIEPARHIHESIFRRRHSPCIGHGYYRDEYRGRTRRRDFDQRFSDACELVKKTQQATRIVIYVEGGVAQAIYSNDKTAKAKLVDFDNMKEEGKTGKQRDATLKRATKGMHEIGE